MQPVGIRINQPRTSVNGNRPRTFHAIHSFELWKNRRLGSCSSLWDGNDDYTQLGNLFRLMNTEQRERLFVNIARHMRAGHTSR
jgi:catalase